LTAISTAKLRKLFVIRNGHTRIPAEF